MGKQVIVTIEENPRVFRTLEEASEAIGANKSSISIAIRERRECQGVMMKYVDRVYLVRKKKEYGIWTLAKPNIRNTAFYPLDQRQKPIKNNTVEEIRDITVAWYNPREEW